jgi:hypothetical protein
MPFPVDRKYIEATEKKLGGRFPESFVVKMMAENGGDVATPPDRWTLHPFLDAGDRKRLARTCNDIVRETQQARDAQGFPPNGVNIGDNGSGDHLVFLLADGRIGPEVHWWDHETGALNLVAEDFSALSGWIGGAGRPARR